MTEWILFGAVALLAIILSAIWSAAEQNRKRSLSKISASLGLNYFPFGLRSSGPSLFSFALPPNDDPTTAQFLARFDGFNLMNHPDVGTVSDLMIGRRGVRDWYCFQYRWIAGSGRNKRQVSYAVVAVRCPLLFKHLMIQPHSWLDSLGVQAIRFESAEFNHRYLVQSDDPKAAYDLLHPEAMELLLKWKPKRMEFLGCYFMVYAPEMAPHEIYETVIDMESFLDTIPDYLKQDIGFRAYWPTPFDV